MIKTILIDDEPNNTIYLQGLIKDHFPELMITAVADNVEDAEKILQELNPQLVFLDIEMPGCSGFELLQKIKPINFEVIFITAHKTHALDAFKVQAAGYITKPINVADFTTTVKNVVNKITAKQVSENVFSMLQQNNSHCDETLALPTQNGYHFVKQTDILYLESKGNYTQFYLNDAKKILVSRQLGEYDKLLSPQTFFRIHEQYIVQLSAVTEYIKGSGVKLSDETILPVAVRRKVDLLNRFSKWTKHK